MTTLSKWRNGTLPNLMEDFFARDLFDIRNPLQSSGVPAVNIRETKDEYAIEVAAPGMKKEDFRLKVENDVLTISSENQSEKEEKDDKGQYTRREFSYQSFQRSFTLPNTVQGDKIEATYTDGVLHIKLPKKEEAKQKPPREIKIS
jgi:HSP20 family protein